MISIILVGALEYFPFVVIAVLARLQTIPSELYEAAHHRWRGSRSPFWDVTLPQLREVLIVIVLLRTIWDFKEFDLIYLLTGGGPGDLDADPSDPGLQTGLRDERNGQGLSTYAIGHHGGAAYLHGAILTRTSAETQGWVAMTRSNRWQQPIVSLAVWTIVLIVIPFPLIWMVITSIKLETELFRIPATFWPTETTFEHSPDAPGKDRVPEIHAQFGDPLDLDDDARHHRRRARRLQPHPFHLSRAASGWPSSSSPLICCPRSFWSCRSI